MAAAVQLALSFVLAFAWPTPTHLNVDITYTAAWVRCQACPRVPPGHRRVDGRDPWPEIISAADAVHRSLYPIDTYVPFQIGAAPPWCGVVLLEPHGATWRRGKRVHLRRPIRGATVFEAHSCPARRQP